MNRTFPTEHDTEQERFKEGESMVVKRSRHRYYERKTETQVIRNSRNRVSWIYEQYHDGKVLTIDDFRYLCTKDPDGCKCIIHNIIENRTRKPVNDHRFHTEQTAIEYINWLEKELVLAQNRLNLLKQEVKPEKRQTLVSVKESLENVKERILVMDQPELTDLLDHLYEASKLREQYEDEVLGWEMVLEETDRYYVPMEESKLEYRV